MVCQSLLSFLLPCIGTGAPQSTQWPERILSAHIWFLCWHFKSVKAGSGTDISCGPGHTPHNQSVHFPSGPLSTQFGYLQASMMSSASNSRARITRPALPMVCDKWSMVRDDLYTSSHAFAHASCTTLAVASWMWRRCSIVRMSLPLIGGSLIFIT